MRGRFDSDEVVSKLDQPIENLEGGRERRCAVDSASPVLILEL
jgi:hypothetical protein